MGNISFLKNPLWSIERYLRCATLYNTNIESVILLPYGFEYNIKYHFYVSFLFEKQKDFFAVVDKINDTINLMKLMLYQPTAPLRLL